MRAFPVSRRSFLLSATALAASWGCRRRSESVVVLYCSLDRPLAAPILAAFTRDTGIGVEVVYDTEATKSTGLASRIVAESSRPRADVFWSSEVARMTQLAADAALAAYPPRGVEEIPARYRDAEGFWTGFAGRFRVLAYNRELAPSPPKTLAELAEPAWRGRVAMADPLFGTTATEAAALFQVWGPEKAEAYYRRRKENKTRLVDGNSVAARLAAEGDIAVAQTDTDDAYRLLAEDKPLGIVFPNQEGEGALMIPNTVGLIHAGPHPEAGKALIDYLIRPETELALARSTARQLPLSKSLQDRLPAEVADLAAVKRLEVDYSRLAENLDAAQTFLRVLFSD